MYLENQVEGQAVGHSGSRDLELHVPPTAAVEAEAPNAVPSAAQLRSHTGPGRADARVIGHPALERQRRSVDRLWEGTSESRAATGVTDTGPTATRSLALATNQKEPSAAPAMAVAVNIRTHQRAFSCVPDRDILAS